ncbi:MAG: hypothetical protein IPP63_12830 [Chloracidobacterium sp.]|nr:hypothetical protein [Chloracidobacterium sp.]
MDHPFFEIIAQYGVYAVFLLCTVEGDITLLISGVLAHSGFFGSYSFIKVLFFGTLGGMVGDCFGYMVGRIFHENAKHYRFFIRWLSLESKKLIEKFGGFTIIISKYIYGIESQCASFMASVRCRFGDFWA